jgi:DNA polymerase III epsilon subunit-like protein
MMYHFAVDTETTGFQDPYPIEIAVVNVADPSICFYARIKTEKEIHPMATKVHGICNLSLKNCRTETEVMNDFVDFIKFHGGPNVTLVAHNSKYDSSVINNALMRSKLEILSNPWECTLEKSRKQKYPKNSLEDCCLRANIPYENSHCALGDAMMCAKIYKFLENEEILNEALAQVNQEEAEFIEKIVRA